MYGIRSAPPRLFTSAALRKHLNAPQASRQRLASLSRQLHTHHHPRILTMAASIPKTMSGILVEKTGGVEVLQYKTDLPVPMPKANEVLVKNEIIGINFIDTYFRTGLYPSQKPEILGREAAGHVVALGPSVSSFKPEDRVVWMHTSSYAEYSTVPVDMTFRIPDNVSSNDACASLIQGMTALTITEESYKVERGDWILVLAASGGTGGWLCQVLKAKGARTIATVGSEAKVAIAKDNGAEFVLVEGTVDVVEEVKKLTDGKGVAAVFDGVGKDTFMRSLSCVARKGTVVSFGNASGAVEPFAIAKLTANNAKVLRPTFFNYIVTPEEREHYRSQLFELLSSQKAKVKIHDVYPLKDVARAHSDLEGRKTTGKLLMKP